MKQGLCAYVVNILLTWKHQQRLTDRLPVNTVKVVFDLTTLTNKYIINAFETHIKYKNAHT